MVKKIKSDKFNFSRLGKRQKTSIVAILIAAFILGLLGSVVYKNLRSSSSLLPARQKLSGQETPQPTKPATLSLKTKDTKIENAESFTVDIYLESPDGVEAADFVVNFDPEFLAVENVAEGNFFKNYPINKVESSFVKLSGVAAFENNTVIVPKGRGVVGTITFNTLKPTDSTFVGFDRDQTIVAYGGKNILDQNKVVDLNITIE